MLDITNIYPWAKCAAILTFVNSPWCFLQQRKNLIYISTHADKTFKKLKMYSIINSALWIGPKKEGAPATCTIGKVVMLRNVIVKCVRGKLHSCSSPMYPRTQLRKNCQKRCSAKANVQVLGDKWRKVQNYHFFRWATLKEDCMRSVIHYDKLAETNKQLAPNTFRFSLHAY
jgi:hypothetical protein